MHARIQVIDPRTLWPLDEGLILTSVRKTGRLVIAHEAPRRGGWGAELLSLVQEKAFDASPARPKVTTLACHQRPRPLRLLWARLVGSGRSGGVVSPRGRGRATIHVVPSHCCGSAVGDRAGRLQSRRNARCVFPHIACLTQSRRNARCVLPHTAFLTPKALDAPITIVAGRDAPLPYNAALEKACIPGGDEIVAAALAAVARPGK